MARISDTPANIVESKIIFGTSNGKEVTHFTNEFTGGLYQKLDFKKDKVIIGIGEKNVMINLSYEQSNNKRAIFTL